MKTKSLKASKSNFRGFGLMEVLIAMAMLFMLSLGVMNLFSNMQKEQKRQQLIAFLTSNRAVFENAFKNENSWGNILNNNAAIAGCIRAVPNNCTGLDTSAPAQPAPPAPEVTEITFSNTIQVYDGAAAPQLVYDGRIQSGGGPYNGFTENGARCNTFDPDPGQGQDACPIGYAVAIIPHSNSPNPKVTIYAKMIFNGSDNNNLNAFFNAPISNLNYNARYDVKVDRTALSLNKIFNAESVRNLTGSGCLTGGFGDCAKSGAGGTQYQNWVIPANGNDFGLISVDNAGVTILETGRYTCTVTTFAFRAGSVETRLTNSTFAGGSTVYGSATGFASEPTAGYTTIQMQANLNVTATPFNLRLWQACDAGGDIIFPNSDINSCQLGFGTTYGGAASVRARITCSKLTD